MLFPGSLPVLFAVLFYAFIIRPPTRWARGTQGGLIGEVYIRDVNDAHRHAAQYVEEANAIWSEPSSNWEITHGSNTKNGASNNLITEVRRITEGPFLNSGILLTRSDGIVEGATDPSEVFDFLTSIEGLKMLDPSMDPEEANKHIESYAWKGHGRGSHLDVHESFIRAVPPGMEERYHIVLNGYDKQNNFFFCKSIIHDGKPGSSAYFSDIDGKVPAAALKTEDPRVRAVSTFYFRMTPTEDKKSTRVQMVNFADAQMGSTMINWILGKAFFPGVYDGLQKRFASA